MQFSDSKISKDVIDIAARIMRGEKIEEKKKMDPVDKDELKGKHTDRDDKDIDNDGDSDESDEYLHKKRKAISKSMKEDQKPIKLKGFGKDKAGMASIKNPIARAALMRKDKAKKEEVEVEEGYSSADRPGQQPKKIKRPKQGDYKNYVDLRPSKLNAPGGRDKVKYVGEEEDYCDCGCDCGKKVCESCGKEHNPASIKESDSYYAHHAAVKSAGGKTSGSDYDHHLGNEMKKRGYSKGAYRGHGSYTWNKTHKPTHESEDMDTANAQKAVKHDCATHVVHKEHGEGRCVPGMHTLEENEDGTGYVTHYDVMFSGEEGPYILEDCPVEDLEIVKEMSHGHKKKK